MLLEILSEETSYATIKQSFGSRWKGFAEIPLSVFPDNIEKINLFAVFGYSQQTEYIFKAIQVKKEEMQLLQKTKFKWIHYVSR